MPKYFQNDEMTYIRSALMDKNPFLSREQRPVELPQYAQISHVLPQIIWPGHEAVIDCYHKAWELAFAHIHNPLMGTKFISPFIDAAFNDCIFMWDCSFILMFGKYALGVFDFQQTLDNFYAHQHRDGFISREISAADSSEKFTRYDPSSTGPNIMPWCEWMYYQFTGDRKRLCDVFTPLLAYHRWMRKNRTWPDGGYFSSGWGCGMDNQPRLQERTNHDVQQFDHGHMTWVDACMQQLLSCHMLLNMAKVCGRDAEVADLRQEADKLTALVNASLWDEGNAFYYDRWANGQLNMVKSIGAYWALLAEAVPEERREAFVAHLENESEFKRPNRVPTLSADDPSYDPDGGYWCGSVWAPTNYMVLQGLRQHGYEALAHDIAWAALNNAVETYCKTGTLWENYAPEYAGRGNSSRSDFVGWSGLFPISMLIEFVFGLDIHADRQEIVWNLRLTDEFGVTGLPVGKQGTVDLLCHARQDVNEQPVIEAVSNLPLTITVVYGDHEKMTLKLNGTV